MTTVAAPRVDTDADAVLERVLVRVRLRIAARLAWLSHIAVDPETQRRRADHELTAADADNPADEAAWQASPTVADLAAAIDAVEADLVADESSRLARLCHLFGLDRLERDLVEACLAAELDPAVARQFTILNHDPARPHPTVPSVARALGHGRSAVWPAESPLRLWGLVETTPVAPGEPEAIALDQQVGAWLQGVDDLDPRLIGVARLHPPADPLSRWPVASFAERIRTATTTAGPVRTTVRGPESSGRRTFAAAVAAELGLQLLVIETDRIPAGAWPAVMLAAQRQAFIDGCALAWLGRPALEEPWPLRTAAFPVQFVVAGAGEAPVPASELVDQSLDLPGPTVAERWALWERYVPEVAGWTDPERSDLVERPHTVVGDIRRVGQQRPAGPGEAVAALTSVIRLRLGSLVTVLERPFRRSDLILPARQDAQIDELLFEARDRRVFWEQPEARRLFPNTGLVALFAGPPGVGKTMAAQVLAGDLGLELLRVNLAETVSKYVGETAKNLDRTLRRAAEIDAVLLFDEADALFGRRTEIRDAHDRFANTDTNFLLQAVESFPGIAVLATNRRDQVDTAFIRRLRHVVDFPRPDAAARAALWRSLVGAIAPDGEEAVARLDATLGTLAEQVDLTGAEIKHAVLNAAFLARSRKGPFGEDELLAGLDRELAKEGRGLSDRERKRVIEGG